MTLDEAKAIAAEKNVPVEKHYTEVGHIINAFFEEFVEETLIQPTFVYGHPVAVSPLAKKSQETTFPLYCFQTLPRVRKRLHQMNDQSIPAVTFRITSCC